MATNNTQNRFKSVVLWSSLLSAIVAFLLGSGLIDTSFGTTLNQVIAGVLTFLTAIGILNNPTDKVNW